MVLAADLTADGIVVAMTHSEFQVDVLGDPRLAAYAASPLPAWLWTADGSRILWANPAGGRMFGAADDAALAAKTFGPADQYRRQVARLAGRLPANGAVRLERLPGFGAAPGMLATCGCSRFDFPNGRHGVLIAAGNVALIAPGPVQIFHPQAEAKPPEAAPPAPRDTAEAEQAARVAPPAANLEQTMPPTDPPTELVLFDAFAESAAEEPSNETEMETPAAEAPDHTGIVSPLFNDLAETIAEPSHPADLEPTVEPQSEALKQELKDILTETPTELLSDALKNVLPFRPLGDNRGLSLTPVENNAFDELARQLSARLENETGDEAAPDMIFEPSAGSELRQPVTEPPEWLAPPEPPAHGEARRDKALLDLLPIGILIYRLDRLLYANPAFLTQMGYPTLHALEDAGGLDALYVEPGVSNASSTSDTGTPVTISASQPSEADAPAAAADARLYTISWDGDSALALIFSGTPRESGAIAAAISESSPVPQTNVPADTGAPAVSEPSAAGHANAEELGAILDTTAEGIVMFDAEGNIKSANRSAEALFGYDGGELTRRNLADLFAPESQHSVFEYLASIKSAGVSSLLDHGRELLGRESRGGTIPLSMTMGRTRADGPNFFAVFRDLSQARKTESELREARRLADRAAGATADVLARISHEVRTPLNAIIGFSEVMIGARFGALGNERYVEYMKDIRASGERVIAIIDDLLDLSRIESGKLDLAFTSQNLNELVESCVAAMQPQANRERIIIRTSLAHTLPPVVADARALRQITLNLIGNSIHLANAGGQVIVSTALSDFGEVMLRVRDTGHGLNDNEVAAALEPFRTPAPDQASDGAGVSLSLTKALVEANRARFQIRTGGRAGTLIEVVFPHAVVRA
jgi:PAS domain S-box-containing protein